MNKSDASSPETMFTECVVSVFTHKRETVLQSLCENHPMCNVRVMKRATFSDGDMVMVALIFDVNLYINT